MAGAGYDISLAASDSNSSGLNNPFSLTGYTFGGGAGRLVNGITGGQIVTIAIALFLVALLALLLFMPKGDR